MLTIFLIISLISFYRAATAPVSTDPAATNIMQPRPLPVEKYQEYLGSAVSAQDIAVIRGFNSSCKPGTKYEDYDEYQDYTYAENEEDDEYDGPPYGLWAICHCNYTGILSVEASELSSYAILSVPELVCMDKVYYPLEMLADENNNDFSEQQTQFFVLSHGVARKKENFTGQVATVVITQSLQVWELKHQPPFKLDFPNYERLSLYDLKRINIEGVPKEEYDLLNGGDSVDSDSEDYYEYGYDYDYEYGGDSVDSEDYDEMNNVVTITDIAEVHTYILWMEQPKDVLISGGDWRQGDWGVTDWTKNRLIKYPLSTYISHRHTVYFEIPSIETLIITNCLETKLSHEFLKPTPKLKKFAMTYSKLNTIVTGAFSKYCYYLLEIDLSWNELYMLGFFCINCPNLAVLIVTGNHLSALELQPALITHQMNTIR